MILVIEYRTGGWCPGHRVVGSWPPSSPFRPVVSRGSPRVSARSYRAYQRARYAAARFRAGRESANAVVIIVIVIIVVSVRTFPPFPETGKRLRLIRA